MGGCGLEWCLAAILRECRSESKGFCLSGRSGCLNGYRVRLLCTHTLYPGCIHDGARRRRERNRRRGDGLKGARAPAGGKGRGRAGEKNRESGRGRLLLRKQAKGGGFSVGDDTAHRPVRSDAGLNSGARFAMPGECRRRGGGAHSSISFSISTRYRSVISPMVWYTFLSSSLKASSLSFAAMNSDFLKVPNRAHIDFI